MSIENKSTSTGASASFSVIIGVVLVLSIDFVFTIELEIIVVFDAYNVKGHFTEKMDYMGFTNRETDEFIMYWLPILERNEQSLVYFEQTEERNEDFPLSFSEEPDALIRTMIHIKKVDGPTDIEEEQLTHYERGGFTVTEWGGTEH